MKKGIVFDLDGTLWDSAENVISAWNVVFRRHRDVGFEITAADMRGLMGKTIPEIAAAVFPTFSKRHGLEIIDECSDEEIAYLTEKGGTLYPDLRRTLSILRKEYALFIVSNCQAGYIEAFLKFHRLADYFDDVECSGRTAKPKGENIRMIVDRNGLNGAVYVGDTDGDRSAAEFAGVPFILAEYGFGDVKGCPYAIDRIADLPGMAQSILEKS